MARSLVDTKREPSLNTPFDAMSDEMRETLDRNNNVNRGPNQ